MQQTGIARPEIIQGQTNTHGLQIVCDRTGKMEIVNQCTFGEFNSQALQIKLPFISNLPKKVWKTPIM